MHAVEGVDCRDAKILEKGYTSDSAHMTSIDLYTKP